MKIARFVDTNTNEVIIAGNQCTLQRAVKRIRQIDRRYGYSFGRVIFSKLDPINAQALKSHREYLNSL